MGTLDNKTALIFGVANHNSIAWAIAQKLAAQGARLAFTYQERMEQNVRKLTASMPDSLVLPCDVENDQEMDAVFEQVGNEFGGLDILIHTVAYAPTDDLKGRIAHISRDGFNHRPRTLAPTPSSPWPAAPSRSWNATGAAACSP